MGPSFLNIARQEPGCGRDVTVPGPPGVVGVAICTRPIDDGADLGGSVDQCIEGFGFIDGRVGPLRLNCLHTKENDRQNDSCPLQRFLHRFSRQDEGVTPEAFLRSIILQPFARRKLAGFHRGGIRRGGVLLREYRREECFRRMV